MINVGLQLVRFYNTYIQGLLFGGGSTAAQLACPYARESDPRPQKFEVF